MKKYLIVTCTALALVGCAKNENRGGLRDGSASQTGNEYDRSVDSTNKTNNSTTSPGTSNGSSTSGSTSDRSSGPGSEK
jgi:hypothetical protein